MITLDEAMKVAQVGGRDGFDRDALRVLRLEVLRLGLQLDHLREVALSGCDGSCKDFGCPSYLVTIKAEYVKETV